MDGFIDLDPRKISWDRAGKTRIAKGEQYTFQADRVFTSTYRPFTRQRVYFDRKLNNTVYQAPPTVPDAGAREPRFLTESVGPHFARYTYRELTVEGGFDFGDEDGGAAYERVDNITEATLAAYRKTYPDTEPGLTRDHIFFYVYGLLHSPAYREAYAADLKKSLPRIPKVRAFRAFAEAGRRLSELHIGYESAKPFGGIVISLNNTRPDMPEADLFRVTKMKIPKTKGVQDRTRIVYNHHITLENIPEEAYEYQLGARSAIEWIIDRYQVKTDPKSGIVNDPNEWSDDPRYVVDLLRRIVTVSLATVEIVRHLPQLDIIEDAG
ncbi:type ISP restriction/modification enzyme [Streptomyces sp. NPDC048110]|uniref:type ISP restriction/modification enzyme n=1 Tax=Streptomyces sp. NPDC048110 TaxID=3155483 RepID=UPI00340D5544